MPISDSNSTYGNDQSATADILNYQGVQGILVVETTAIEVKVGADKLVDRKSTTLFNNSNSIIYWGYTNTVTVATGTPIFKNQSIEWNAGDNISIWVISGSLGNNTRITEAS